MLSKFLDIWVWSLEERFGLQINLGVNRVQVVIEIRGVDEIVFLRKYGVKIEKELRFSFEKFYYLMVRQERMGFLKRQRKISQIEREKIKKCGFVYIKEKNVYEKEENGYCY